MKNKTSQYFKYAIGEIILVVIGILIALQINNWNEQQNKEAKIAKILKEIQDDIQTDLIQANKMFDYQLYTDSIAKGILNNKFTAEDYKSNRIPTIGYNYRDFKIVTNGFENLKGNIDNIPKHYENLLPAIKNIYVNLKTDIDVGNTTIRENVYKSVDAAHKFDWSQENLKGIVSEAEIDYLLNDKDYKNLVANYMNYRRNIFSLSNEYRVAAIDLYLKINEALGNEDVIPESINYNYKSETPINNYMGTYTLKETVNPDFWPETLTIKNNDEQLMIQIKENVSFSLFYYNETTFFSEDYYGLVVFDRPNKDEIYLSTGINAYAIYEKTSAK